MFQNIEIKKCHVRALPVAAVDLVAPFASALRAALAIGGDSM